jgi:hypothetical protein
MSKKQFGFIFSIFAALLVVALVGGTWGTALAQGTVPRIPVTGCVSGLPNMGDCQGPYVKDLGGVCIPFVVTEEVKAKGDQAIPGLDQIQPVTDILKVTVMVDGTETTDFQFSDSVMVYFTQQGAIQKYMAEPGVYSIFWFDPDASKWVKVETTLLDGKLVDQNVHSGLYVVGK